MYLCMYVCPQKFDWFSIRHKIKTKHNLKTTKNIDQYIIILYEMKKKIYILYILSALSCFFH